MSRFEDGCYGSLKGVALIGKVLAGRCKMHYTRVAVGKGTIPEGMTPKTLEEPPEYVMDAMISSVTNPVDGECQVSVQIDSAAVETGFYATGLQLYAEDPDEGEIPYTYLVLENEPEWIRPASSIVGKLAYFDIIAAVGDVDKVYATIDPDALVTRAAALQMLTEHDADPDAHPDIIRSIMMGALALPLTADTGEALLTSSGRPIHAVYELERSGSVLAGAQARLEQAEAGMRAYTQARLREAMGALSAEMCARIEAHDRDAAAHPTHLAAVRK